MTKKDIRRLQRKEKYHHHRGSKVTYCSNRKAREHTENPSLYGEKTLSCSPKNIRVPKKCRKTAMKRFKKAFPSIKVDKLNKPYFRLQLIELVGIEASKILNK